MSGPPLPDDPDFFLKLVAPLVHNAFTASLECRNHYLTQCLRTAKAITRLCQELAPTFFPSAKPADVTSFLDKGFVKDHVRLAALAGLDQYQTESFVLVIQQAIKEVGEETEMKQEPNEDPAIQSGRDILKVVNHMLELVTSVQSIVFEQEAKIRDMQKRIDSLEAGSNA